MTEDEMAGWHYRLFGHEFERTLGVSDGQGRVSDHTIMVVWVIKIFFVQFSLFLPSLLNMGCFC